MKESLLTELQIETETPQHSVDDLRVRLERLESESQETRRQNNHRAVLAELKIEAMRANIIDLDGLQFLDTTKVSLCEDGTLDGGVDEINRLKRAKPWLFAPPSSSSVANVPLSNPLRQKHAKDMSDAEYRVARANIVKQSKL